MSSCEKYCYTEQVTNAISQNNSENGRKEDTDTREMQMQENERQIAFLHQKACEVRLFTVLQLKEPVQRRVPPT